MSEMYLTIPLTEEQRARYEQRARELGFASLADYVLDLLQESELDWEEFEKTGYDEDEEEDDDEIIDLEDTLKRSWGEAMKGNTRPISELRDALNDE